MKNVHQYLSLAGQDAEIAYDYNKDKAPHMRISRVGLPLANIILEDFILSKMPPLLAKEKTKERANAEYVKRSMSQANGFLFEQLIIDILKKEENLEVLTQVKLRYGDLEGSCDILVLNHESRKATVVECKAIKYGTKKDCTEFALYNNDLTGYTSQLAVYKEAAALIYPEYATDALWMVWAKATASLFKVPFSTSGSDSLLLSADAVLKVDAYNSFKTFYEAKDVEGCLNILKLDELPMKQYNNFGYISATIPVHFNPWMNILVDEDGVPFEDAEKVLALMLAYSMNALPELTDEIASELLKLLADQIGE